MGSTSKHFFVGDGIFFCYGGDEAMIELTSLLPVNRWLYGRAQGSE